MRRFIKQYNSPVNLSKHVKLTIYYKKKTTNVIITNNNTSIKSMLKTIYAVYIKSATQYKSATLVIN